MKNVLKKNLPSSIMNSRFHFSIIILLLISFTGLVRANQAPTALETDWFKLITERIQASQKSVNVANVDASISASLPILNADGSFTDVNYADISRTNWSPLTHLDRLKNFALGYTMPSSAYYQDASLHASIVKMLELWYAKHPVSDNWFNNQISAQQRVGLILIILRSGLLQVPSTIEANLIERMKVDGNRPDQPGSYGTGANKLDIATHWVYRGCLTRDQAVLSFGADQIYYPLFLTTGEGLQHDYSYQQHGNQLYVGGYGHVLVNGILNMALFMNETPYGLPQDKVGYLSEFIRGTFLSLMRGKYYLYNVLGRGISRKNETYQSGFWGTVTKMMSIDPQNTAEYEQAILRLKGTEAPSFGVKAQNKHFWRSDYTVHQRSGYAFDVRMVSKYTCRNENGNGENLKGYFLADGATNIALNGDEYAEIFPVWDWARIPGVTAPVVTTIPKTGTWGVYGKNNFAGTASDGRYGVSAYYLNDKDYGINTSARKAWFFFDNEVVCLGADINSTNAQPINTTLNQCLLKGDVILKSAGAETVIPKGLTTHTNPSWVLHDGVGYVFPKGGNLSISNQTQSGAWSAINTTQISTPISKDVFKIWFDHGVNPTKGTYEYIVVPNKYSAAEMNSYSVSDIQILANTDSVQAVKHNGLNILGLVFTRAAKFTYADISVSADKGATVILKNIGTPQVEVYVSDPTRSQANITLKTQLPHISGISELACSFPVAPNPYAGQTKQFVIDESTPKTQTTAVGEFDKVNAIEDAYVRDGASFETANYGTVSTLQVKKDGVGYNREVYLKFDLQNINIDQYEKVYLSLNISHSNVSINQTQWLINYVADDNWAESTLTWKTKPVTVSTVSTISTVPAGSNITVDITQLVIDEIKNNNKILTLNIAATERGDGKADGQIYAKENTDATKVSQLLLQKKVVVEAQAKDIIAVEDAWVRDGSANEGVNNGATSTLIVKQDNAGYTREAFIKFNTEELGTDNVDKAILKLHVSNANTSISTINWLITPVATSWSESTLTWLNKPVAGAVIASAQGQVAGSTVEFDVTDYVKAQRAKGIKVVAFRIAGDVKSVDGKSDAQFFSKESSDLSQHPRLSVITSVNIPLVVTRSLEESFDNQNRGVKVYPNPLLVGDVLNITLPIASQTAEIYILDMFGRTVIKTNDTQIRNSSLPAGIYILKVKDSQHIENNATTKFMVK